MSDQHTNERLVINQFGGVSKGEGGDTIIPSDASIPEADKRRVAAAWNACEGMPTEHIEALSGCGSIGDLHASELAAARALLRESLETFDDNHAEDHEIADRIRSYLDASDKQGGGHV